MELDISEATITVVGAYGLVGRAAAILLGELQPAGPTAMSWL
jgi:hypothetical protein